MGFGIFHVRHADAEALQHAHAVEGGLHPDRSRRRRMYVCGPTVYDFAHIGNARPVIVSTCSIGCCATYTARSTSPTSGTSRTSMTRSTSALRALDQEPPAARGDARPDEGTAAQYLADVRARSAASIPTMRRAPPNMSATARSAGTWSASSRSSWSAASRMRPKACAVLADAMNALAETSGLPQYGMLSRRPLDEMIAGARVDVAPYKRDPMDFVLWKPSDPATEPGWDSPWGSPTGLAQSSARHVRRAARRDLRHPCRRHRPRFPHHENEIAQSCCAFGRRADGERLDAQWLPAGGRPEDVEEPRQLHDHSRGVGPVAGRGARG